VAIACPISPFSHLQKPSDRLTVAGLGGTTQAAPAGSLLESPAGDDAASLAKYGAGRSPRPHSECTQEGASMCAGRPRSSSHRPIATRPVTRAVTDSAVGTFSSPDVAKRR